MSGMVAPPAPSFLEVSGVTLRYRTATSHVTATYRVNFAVEQSDRFVMLGPSGCGKSTLLKAIGGYMVPAEGGIALRGVPITRPGPDRIMIFQEFDQLLPWKTVAENVAFPLVASGKLDRRHAKQAAAHFVDKVGLGRFAHSYPHTLSGGMKQRVAIARGLAMGPDLLLMDEPFAALDELTRRRMQDELLALLADAPITLIFVTHSISEAIRIGSRILLLSPHPGRVRIELPGLPADAPAAAAAELEREIHGRLFEHA
jgi:NitT/TauT family transport system ATP-binding protein